MISDIQEQLALLLFTQILDAGLSIGAIGRDDECRTRTAIPSFANPSMSDPYLPLFYISAMNEWFQLKLSTPTIRLDIAIFKRFQFCCLRVVQGQLIESQSQ